jgi:2,3-dihydroxybenzoate-AMP ligase
MPDTDLGERVCLYAVLQLGATLTLEQIRAAMSAQGVATFKWPERLEVVDDLATTKIGKIDKKALRADIAARLDDAKRHDGTLAQSPPEE